VYFRVARYPEYGRLSGAQLDDMVAQEPNPLKEDPRDFALWKSQKPHEDAAWDSPWGPGRPGWHIECSAMAEKHLGPEFEIHGGGLDLRFPHHENELAQSRSRGYSFARVWIHNGMLEMGDEKMSKSLGNVVTLRNVLDVWGREVLLLYHLSAHWRKPVDFTDEALERARTQLVGFREALALPEREQADDWGRLEAALEDDFNTPEALAVLHDWSSRGARSLLARGLDLFGIATTFDPPERILALLRERDEARAGKDWDRADAIRAAAAADGWLITDHPGGSVVYPKP
jgi:cysteinyl-tRNA synthetase